MITRAIVFVFQLVPRLPPLLQISFVLLLLMILGSPWFIYQEVSKSIEKARIEKENAQAREVMEERLRSMVPPGMTWEQWLEQVRKDSQNPEVRRKLLDNLLRQQEEERARFQGATR